MITNDAKQQICRTCQPQHDHIALIRKHHHQHHHPGARTHARTHVRTHTHTHAHILTRMAACNQPSGRAIIMPLHAIAASLTKTTTTMATTHFLARDCTSTHGRQSKYSRLTLKISLQVVACCSCNSVAADEAFGISDTACIRTALSAQSHRKERHYGHTAPDKSPHNTQHSTTKVAIGTAPGPPHCSPVATAVEPAGSEHDEWDSPHDAPLLKPWAGQRALALALAAAVQMWSELRERVGVY
jgi:hypothetical protein